MPLLQNFFIGPGVRSSGSIAGHFIDDDHQQDVVGILDRSKALADFDAVEAAAPFELVCDLRDQRIGGRLADHVADDAEDVGIGRGVVAVHAHFADDARRGLRVRDAAQPSASSNDRRTHENVRRTPVERRVLI